MRWPLLAVLTIAALTYPAQAQTRAKQPPVWERTLSQYLAEKFDFDAEKDHILALENMIKLPVFLELRMYKGWVHDISPRTNNIRLTGPFIDGIGQATHARVRVYYSNGVVEWLKGGRQGAIKDGEMIVKEMFFADPAIADTGEDKLTGWAVMVRDSKASFDGWLWYLQFQPGDKTFQQGFVPRGGTFPGFLAGQYGMSFCLACHASADNDQLTFASIRNIEGQNTDAYTYIAESFSPMAPEAPAVEGQLFSPGTHATWIYDGKFVDRPGMSAPLQAPNPAIEKLFKKLIPERDSLKSLPMNLIWDHVVPGPDGPAQFVSADSCRGCHDASALLGNRLPAMAVVDYERVGDQPNVFTQYNLSEWGEWSSSMMGLSGRDPVFHAQLEAERALRPEYGDYIADFCLSCHTPMGQRSFHAEFGDDQYFTEDILYETSSGKYAKEAVLARDGVSCTVCHHITPEKLGTAESFNAKFDVGPPDEVYGPFDDPLTYPMQQAVGITPKPGAQIVQSKLCGSCHTVRPPAIPIYPNGGGPNPPPPPTSYPQVHEQSTYLEWLNSLYNDETRKTPKTRFCAECHMPDVLPRGLTQNDPKSPTNILTPKRDLSTLSFQIANVEDGYYPELDNRADFEEITPPLRPYRRHTLVGLNVFTTRMVQQFHDLVGYSIANPELNSMSDASRPVWRLELTEREAIDLGRHHTIELGIENIEQDDETLNVDVHIKNLAGHKFPTGVGFRRAFVYLAVHDENDNVIWASGRTDKAGVITDQHGNALPAEMTTDWNELQPDYSPDNPVTRQDQVQIYESRHEDNTGKLSTSFLSLFQVRKDNRILPAGWSRNGPYAETTQPHALGGEPVANPDAGFDRVRYEIPLADIPNANSVQARVYYQSLPPYYLRDRFEIDGPATDRLYYMVSYLNLDNSPMQDWKFELASVTARL